jgi:hypothetical protein
MSTQPLVELASNYPYNIPQIEKYNQSFLDNPRIILENKLLTENYYWPMETENPVVKLYHGEKKFPNETVL